MERRDFLKKLGIGVGITLIVPTMLATESTESNIILHDFNPCLNDVFTINGKMYVVTAKLQFPWEGEVTYELTSMEFGFDNLSVTNKELNNINWVAVPHYHG